VDVAPSYKTYEVQWEGEGNVLQLVKQIHDEQDRSLAFVNFACGYKFCNGCMMTINGQATHACMTFVKPGNEFVLEPLKGHPIIKDLVVDFGTKVTTPTGTYEISKGAVLKEVKTQS
ncbi:2Fe-2S iron-sulfur cluster-binding protein, partial [Candidatus Bathyarchaeota archaeon]|nr:2Fe-2S iron-sulfur cluster-binding protein [Candidatus Bathyarchaeota archaeon]